MLSAQLDGNLTPPRVTTHHQIQQLLFAAVSVGRHLLRLGRMWRSQYGAPPIERPVRGLEELSPPGSMTRSSASSPSTVSLRSSSSYSSRSPSPVFKTQTNGAGWGHCARRGSNRSQC